MKKVFDHICVSLMLINNNVYTFISGILLSLSTGIITTLCFEKTPFWESWHLYASSIIYAISGALFIYVATRITAYQNYIASKQIVNRKTQREIIVDFEEHRYRFWVCEFLALILSLIFGTIFLFLNYVI